jgi:hypothetical protein
MDVSKTGILDLATLRMASLYRYIFDVVSSEYHFF